MYICPCTNQCITPLTWANLNRIDIQNIVYFYNGFAVETLKSLAESTEKQDLVAVLKENDLAIFRQGNEYYCVDFTHKCIFNLASEGIDFKALLPAPQELQPMPVQDSHHSNNILNNVLSQQRATSDHNAEWEMGGNGDYGVDGEWKLRRS